MMMITKIDPAESARWKAVTDRHIAKLGNRIYPVALTGDSYQESGDETAKRLNDRFNAMYPDGVLIKGRERIDGTVEPDFMGTLGDVLESMGDNWVDAVHEEWANPTLPPVNRL